MAIAALAAISTDPPSYTALTCHDKPESCIRSSFFNACQASKDEQYVSRFQVKSLYVSKKSTDADP